MFEVIREGLRRSRLDDQGAVVARLLLTCRMAVIPIRTILANWESIGECITRFDAAETYSRDSIHTWRKQQSVPMNGSIFLESVGHSQDGIPTFSKADQWSGNRAIDGDHRALSFSKLEGLLTNQEIHLSCRFICITPRGNIRSRNFSGVNGNKTLQTRQQANCSRNSDEAATVERL